MKEIINYLFLLLMVLPEAIYALNQSAGKDLRPLFEKYGFDVYDQGERNTCSVFAITGLLEFEYAHTQKKTEPLSVEYLNWASNKITGELADGSYFSDALRALNKYGICSSELFPYNIRNYNNKVAPSQAAIKEAKKRRCANIYWIKEWDPTTGMTEAQMAQVKQQILNEHPVVIGFRWPKKEGRYRRMENGIMVVPPEEDVYDGHSVIIVGFKDDPTVAGGGYFIFKNSYGNSFGEEGYGKMPYQYVFRYANDGVVIHLKK